MADLLSQEEFMERALQKQSVNINLQNAKYKNARTKVQVSCNTCTNSWEIIPKVLMGKAIKCPFCEHRTRISSSYGNEPTTLYILEINLDSGCKIYKVGITKYSVLQRFNPDDLRRIHILKEWKFPTGEQAYNYEKALHGMLKNYRYYGDFKLSSHGNTELFTINPLSLLGDYGGSYE